MNDKTWNPWHGCHKCSEGCQNCYAYFLDKRYGRDTSVVEKNKSTFDFPVKKDREGNYKLKSGEFVRVCMTSDFFLEEADAWRTEAWDFIRRLILKKKSRQFMSAKKHLGSLEKKKQVGVYKTHRPKIFDIPSALSTFSS